MTLHNRLVLGEPEKNNVDIAIRRVVRRHARRRHSRRISNPPWLASLSMTRYFAMQCRLIASDGI